MCILFFIYGEESKRIKIFLQERSRELPSFPQKHHTLQPQVRATSLHHPHPVHKGWTLRWLEPKTLLECVHPASLSVGPVLVFEGTLNSLICKMGSSMKSAIPRESSGALWAYRHPWGPIILA